MNTLSAGTDNISAETGQTIGAEYSIASSSFVYSTASITYTISSSYTIYANYTTNQDSYNVTESRTTIQTPSLVCTSSGSTSVTLSIADYTSTAPSWVSVDSSTGNLIIAPPDLSSESSYQFYINAAVSGASSPVQKLITVSVRDWVPNNWLVWASTSSTVWEIWKSGFVVYRGVWIFEATPALSTTNTVLAVVSIALTALSSSLNGSSPSAIWSIVNQLQLFFLILMTRAFIPMDIKVIIEGSESALNIYDYIPFKDLGLYSSFVKNFEFELPNSAFDSLDIQYDSTIVNIYSFLVSIVFMVAFHMWIWLLMCFVSKWRDSQNRLIKLINNTVKKMFVIMTFAYYIRNILEMSEYFLISSINEINLHSLDDNKKIASFVIAVLVVLFFMAFLGFVILLIFSSYKLVEEEHNKLGEFFSGLRNSKIWYLYIGLLLLRRYIFLVLLITLSTISSQLLIGLLIIVQVFYSIYIFAVRPFDETKWNIIEALNEVYFTFLFVLFCILNTENDWNSEKIKIFMWVLSSNTMMILVISISKSCFPKIIVDTAIFVIKSIKSKCQKKSVSQQI